MLRSWRFLLEFSSQRKYSEISMLESDPEFRSMSWTIEISGIPERRFPLSFNSDHSQKCGRNFACCSGVRYLFKSDYFPMFFLVSIFPKILKQLLFDSTICCYVLKPKEPLLEDRGMSVYLILKNNGDITSQNHEVSNVF